MRRGRGSNRGRPGDRPDRSVPRGGEQRRRSEGSGKSGIDAFELFCAYHMGIGPDKAYRPANIHDVARRFGVDSAAIRQALQDHGMDPETILDTDFDLTMAQMDIQVAPEGIDRIELAKGIFRDFRNSPRRKRDWQKILSEDARENAKIFTRKGGANG